jgi:broad specificity phosphatase PhoE
VRLFLVRHGETDSNQQGLALGRANVPLNETGLRQARLVADRLAAEPVIAVYTSPLRRTMETAEAIADRHGLGVRPEPGLIEMDIGEMDGLKPTDIRDRYPGFLERWMGADGPMERMPGGERLADVAERASETLGRLAEQHQGESVVAVTHNFVLLTLTAQVLGIEIAHFRRLRHSLAATTLLDVQPDHTRVLGLNDTCHLAS